MDEILAQLAAEVEAEGGCVECFGAMDDHYADCSLFIDRGQVAW